jgi:membrane protease subunit HflC
MKLKGIGIILIVAIVVGGIVASQALFVVDQTQYGVVTRFGEIQRIIKTPGLQSKLPVVESVTRFDKRLLRIDVPAESMPDREQQFLEIDAYVRYRIINPRKFLERLRDEFTAADRIGRIVMSELRRVVAGSDRTEIIGGIAQSQPDGTLVVIPHKTAEGVYTREALTKQVLRDSNKVIGASDLQDFGIEIVDVRIKAADFPGTVEQTVFNRMRTERDVQGQRMRAEGEEQHLTITTDVDRQVAIILAEADRTANTVRGEGEAQAIKILADALEKDPEFFAFRRSLEAYGKILPQKSIVVLSSENDLFKYLEGPLEPTK